ncbi:hypothetical protein [Butyrivibrio sp. AE3004]|uniref:hypothetical protein n=1 Tax=Butyrivibrio sp. AE3004 TaxID=1506994 RepID=UPI00049426A8|nr:hypothetical protein [Butyrivibrio sp. AE3004]
MTFNLDDRLGKMVKKAEKEKKSPALGEEEEETYLYDVRKPAEFINKGENDVFDITKQTGIDTKESVFDKEAVFRTK